MVLFLHNRYRTTGGEERAVEGLMAVVREQLHEPAELLSRSSTEISSAPAALALLRGGVRPQEVADAVGASGARVVHAHNLHPALGWRALAAARHAGARVVLHLHQYRLVCAIGVCFTRGAECTRCRGRDTLPGVRLNCRGSLPEAAAYGAALALWQRRTIEQADAFVVPSVFARERLRELGAPLPWERVHVIAPPVAMSDPLPEPRLEREGAPSVGTREPEREPPPGPMPDPAPMPLSGAGQPGPGADAIPYALVVSRLAPEKGVDVAIEACRLAGLALVVAGDGPLREQLQASAGPNVRFAGRVDDAELARLRAGASIALVPSRSAETFGLAAAEAMAAALPVAASRAGALGELVDEGALVAPGDAPALAQAIVRLAGDRAEGARNAERARAVCAPAVVADALARVYDSA
jgi:glycosyltransferase involved in cell wall biosynthesis